MRMEKESGKVASYLEDQLHWMKSEIVDLSYCSFLQACQRQALGSKQSVTSCLCDLIMQARVNLVSSMTFNHFTGLEIGVMFYTALYFVPGCCYSPSTACRPLCLLAGKQLPWRPTKHYKHCKAQESSRSSRESMLNSPPHNLTV